MAIVPADWMPTANMKRIITHWTAGGYEASNLALTHYHIIIDGDSKLHRGTHTIADNDTTSDDVYAAHTRMSNTGSIGISVCCMAGAIESPFNGGTSPMKETQWRTMAQVAAELCGKYGIPVDAKTVLGHGEVQKTLGIAQNGKWDPMVLPWDQQKSKDEVGDMFRALVRSFGGGTVPAPPLAPPTTPSGPIGTPIPYPNVAMKQGATGPHVTSVQQQLMALGHPLQAHGKFDPKTDAAVKALQQSKGLVPDGVVGPKTWKALFG